MVEFEATQYKVHTGKRITPHIYIAFGGSKIAAAAKKIYIKKTRSTLFMRFAAIFSTFLTDAFLSFTIASVIDLHVTMERQTIDNA